MIFVFLITFLAALIAGIITWELLDPRRFKAEPVGFDPEVERLLEMEVEEDVESHPVVIVCPGKYTLPKGWMI